MYASCMRLDQEIARKSDTKKRLRKWGTKPTSRYVQFEILLSKIYRFPHDMIRRREVVELCTKI